MSDTFYRVAWPGGITVRTRDSDVAASASEQGARVTALSARTE